MSEMINKKIYFRSNKKKKTFIKNFTQHANLFHCMLVPIRRFSYIKLENYKKKYNYMVSSNFRYQ